MALILNQNLDNRLFPFFISLLKYCLHSAFRDSPLVYVDRSRAHDCSISTGAGRAKQVSETANGRPKSSVIRLSAYGRFQPFASGINAQLCADPWLLRVVVESFANIGGQKSASASMRIISLRSFRASKTFGGGA